MRNIANVCFCHRENSNHHDFKIIAIQANKPIDSMLIMLALPARPTSDQMYRVRLDEPSGVEIYINPVNSRHLVL